MNRLYNPEHHVIVKSSLVHRYLNAKTQSARLRILYNLSTDEQLALLSEVKRRIDGKNFTQTHRNNKIAKAKELHEKGYSYAQIARELRISRTTAYNYVHKE